MYNNFISQGINNVKFIAVGKSQYESFNWKWTDDNSIPVVVDQSPYNIWGEWNANKWDIFILDSIGELHETFNINPWDEDRILSAINALLPTLKYNPIPDKYELLEISPNPFNPSAQIKFSSNEYGPIQIKFLNIMGQELELLSNGIFSPGIHTMTLNAENYSSGIYFISLKTNSFITSQKIILSK